MTSTKGLVQSAMANPAVIRDTQTIRDGLKAAISIIDRREAESDELNLDETIRLKDKVTAISMMLIRAVRQASPSVPITPPNCTDSGLR